MALAQLAGDQLLLAARAATPQAHVGGRGLKGGANREARQCPLAEFVEQVQLLMDGVALVARFDFFNQVLNPGR